MSRSIIIAGAGFKGMSLAAHLSRLGFDVEVYEKCDSTEGPGQRLTHNEFQFDKTTSINLIPEVLERFFNQFNRSTANFLRYKKLNPSIRFFFSPDDSFDLLGDTDSTASFFREIEKKGDRKYRSYLKKAKAEKHKLIDNTLSTGSIQLKDIVPAHQCLPWRRHYNYVKSLFSDYRLRAILQFPVSFLRLMPPASQQHLFTLNYNIHSQGVYYPEGGMGKIYDGMFAILNELNVPVNYGSIVSNFDVIENMVCGVLTNQKSLHADIYVSATDYSTTEHMLTSEYRNYPTYSSAIGKGNISSIHFFLAFNIKINKLKHHNLVFSDGFESYNVGGKKSSDTEINNMLYINCPSKTEKAIAPPGMDSLVVYMQVPSGMEDTGKMREHYFKLCLRQLEEITGQSLEDKVVFKKTVTSNDMLGGFSSISGAQTSDLGSTVYSGKKFPRIRNKHLSNLYYSDLSEMVGSGISSSILSGEAMASTIHADFIRQSQ